MLIRPKPGVLYYDRGDFVTGDWTQATLTADGEFHALDLSDIIPVGTTAVLLQMWLQNAIPGSVGQFRTAGNVNSQNTRHLYTQINGVYVSTDMFVAPSADRRFEYMFSDVVWSSIILNVVGWFA